MIYLYGEKDIISYCHANYPSKPGGRGYSTLEVTGVLGLETRGLSVRAFSLKKGVIQWEAQKKGLMGDSKLKNGGHVAIHPRHQFLASVSPGLASCTMPIGRTS